ncbi:hypothetical protein [Arcobacter vandammei]|uniref:hypothetical protein n=1 Tax=Arcobacter vandammei TaxID=2782243 RepID=UPI0018DF9C67|nr:hypothetical protein [Arcobacter vandammei]
MGNIYQVVEKGSIKCACGGKVVLKSSSPNMVIGDSKPLYWRDLLGANIIGCPSNSPCTKVSTITSLGTEKNVADSYSSFLLRTDGFKSNKGREIVLIDSGQHTSSIPPTPTSENSVVDFEKDIIETSQEDRKKIHSTKYRLYLLRRSKDELKPLRPTRAFRNSKETSQIEEETLLTYQVYTHTFAYLYITQESIIKEYKVAYKGQAYNETFLDIYFIDENNHKLDFIPIEKDNEIKISYSNFKLNITKDKSIIDKLDKTTIKPSNIGNIKEKAFYSTQASSLNFKSLDIKEPIFESYSNHKPNLKSDKNINIFCVIDDILGEIEDRYFELENSFKYAYNNNYKNIKVVQQQNSYPFTISNIIEQFYIDTNTQKDFERLKEIYNNLVEIFLSNEKYINILFPKSNGDLSWIFEKDKHYVGLNYLNKVKNRYYFFFDEYETSMHYEQGFSNKSEFYTKYYGWKYVVNNTNKSNISLSNSNSKYTLVKQNANELLAALIFTVIFTLDDDLETVLKSNETYSKIDKFRLEFDEILDKLKPIPFIPDNKKRDIVKYIESNEIYAKILNRHQFRASDSYLQDYKNLDIKNSKYSFSQKGEKFSKIISSKYLYYEDFNFHKKTDEFEYPNELMKEIHNKLKSEDLKELLVIYNEIKNTDKINYIIGAKNIVYLLCAQRLNLDEESIFNNIFHKDLNHILEYYQKIIERMKKVEEDDEDINNENDEIIGDKLTNRDIAKIKINYKISSFLSNMIAKSYYFAILQDTNSDFHKNAKSFIDYDVDYDKKLRNNEEKRDKFKYVEQTRLSLILLEKIKDVEAVSSGVEKILDEIIKGKDEQYKNIVERYLAGLKSFSNTIAFLKIIDFSINSEKNIKDYSQFANDTVTLYIFTSKFLANQTKIDTKTLLRFSTELANKKTNLFVSLDFSAKVNIITIIIIATFDTKKYYENDDYDAMALNLMLTGMSLIIALSIMPLPTTIVISIFSIILGITLNQIVDSELTVFLKRTIFNRQLGSGKKYYLQDLYNVYFNDNKTFYPYYLGKALKDEDLGFTSSKELKNFIGKNYKTYEKEFELAFKNELQFLYTTLVGLKLEIDEREKTISKKVNGFLQDINRNLYCKTYLKIPETLIDDDTIFLLNNINYDVKNNKFFEKPDKVDYYLFDLQPYHNETIKINTIIVKSSMVDLKYQFEFYLDLTQDPRHKNSLTIKNFKQINFEE